MNALDLIRQQNWASDGTTSLVATFLSTPTSGNLLVANAGGNTAWANITAPSGWTEANHVSPSGSQWTAIWYKISDGTETTVTVGSSVSVPLRLHILEGPAVNASPLDVTTANSSAASVLTLSSGTTAATAQANEFAIAVFTMNNSMKNVTSLTNDFERVLDIDVGERVIVGAKVLSATGTQETTATWTIVSSGTAVGAVIATFKLPSAPSAATFPRKRVSHGYLNSTDNTTGTNDTLITFPLTANKLYLAFVGVSKDGGVELPTISDSHGATQAWTAIDAAGIEPGPARRVRVFRAMPSANQAASSISIVTGETGSSIWWTVLEIDGIKTSGTNGADAIRQSVNEVVPGATASTADVDFLAATLSTGAVVGCLLHGVAEKHNHDTSPAGHLLLAEHKVADKNHQASVQWYQGADDSLHWDWSTSIHWIAVAVELAVVDTPAQASPATFTMTGLKNAVKTRLETISGLRVFNQPMDSINQFPSAVILNEGITYPLTFGGTNAEGTLRVAFFVDSAVTEQACRTLDTYLHPGNATSVVQALYGDSSLGGTAQVMAVGAENIGVRQLPDGNAVVGADFLLRWVR